MPDSLHWFFQSGWVWKTSIPNIICALNNNLHLIEHLHHRDTVITFFWILLLNFTFLWYRLDHVEKNNDYYMLLHLRSKLLQSKSTELQKIYWVEFRDDYLHFPVDENECKSVLCTHVSLSLCTHADIILNTYVVNKKQNGSRHNSILIINAENIFAW